MLQSGQIPDTLSGGQKVKLTSAVLYAIAHIPSKIKDSRVNLTLHTALASFSQDDKEYIIGTLQRLSQQEPGFTFVFKDQPSPKSSSVLTGGRANPKNGV